jgi:hypothetical protein
MSVGSIGVNQNGSYAIPITYTVTNIGASAALPTWYDIGYLSADAVLSNGDAIVGVHTQSAALAAGASYTVTDTFITPTTTAVGSYTLIVKADAGLPDIGGSATDHGVVGESDETNNTQGMTITLPGRPDLTIASLSVGAIAVNPNGSYSIPVTYTVTNVGESPAQPNWYDIGYLSADGVLDNADVTVGVHAQSVALAPGASYTVTGSFITPTTTTAGSYTLIVKADAGLPDIGGRATDNGVVAEGNETNNTASVVIVLP